MLNTHKILIDNDSTQLSTSDFVILEKAPNDYSLQCIIKNTAKLSYEVRTVELRLYGLDSKFMGYKTFLWMNKLSNPVMI